MNPLVRPVLGWYAGHARPLPWRTDGCDPWAVLVSEVMLQQTPAARVEPVWRAWLARWPDPAALAGADAAEVIRAWGALGYPRRALRLHECARQVLARHGGRLPDTEAALRDLPGVGAYTAAAVAAFAFGRRALVLDTNIRRVLARAVTGRAWPAPSVTRAERDLAEGVVPRDPAAAVRWNQAVMELGALVCRAAAPACDACPLATRCAWLAAGRPAGSRRPAQGYEGTDRQARGRVLALLRAAESGVGLDAVLDALPRPDQTRRAVAGLVADGLAVLDGERLRLP